MATYDRPVKNLVAALNETGHVTHTKHRKDMVTIHHNGGRLSHEGVLQVWQTRPASAHLNVDGRGTVAQFVELNEYAWACGNTEGNQRSVSIEMANSEVGGNWPVADVTWREAARLAGWLFAVVIGARPSVSNMVMHNRWKATLCAGPFIGSKMAEMIALANQSYDYFRDGGSTQPPPSSGGKTIGDLASEVIAGQWGNGEDRKRRVEQAGYNYAQVQAEVNRRLGGSSPAPSLARPSLGQIVDQVISGQWGNGDDRRRRLEQAGYNYNEVQSEVNRRLGGGAPAAHRPSVGEIASQVIAGQWGNGVTRRQRLEGAGYNYAQVQAEVNRRLR